VKASAEANQVDLFAFQVKLIQLQNPNIKVQGVFISPGSGEDVKKRGTE